MEVSIETSMPKSLRNYEKKIMLGTSDAWSMSRSSSDPGSKRIILKIVGFQMFDSQSVSQVSLPDLCI